MKSGHIAAALALVAGVMATGSRAFAQDVALDSATVSSPTTFTPDAPRATAATSTCVPRASIAIRGGVGSDGNWHDAPSSHAMGAFGGGPCVAGGDGIPTPQMPMGNDAPRPLAAPPPPAVPSLRTQGTSEHIVFVYRARLRPVDRTQVSMRR